MAKTTEEVLALFTETALKADKCIDFDIKYWIEKYDMLRKEPRFAEIAMLIMSAAQIYGRKVDYVEEFILNLCKAFKSLENAENKDGSPANAAAVPAEENRPRRRTKRMRPEMLSEKLVRTEYVAKAIRIVPLAKITEKLSIEFEESEGKARPQGRSLKQDVLQWKINFPDETGKTKPRPNRSRIEEEELYSRYTNFGKSYLYDYEDDEVLGIKKDFKCFAGYIDADTNALLSDLNMRKFYKEEESHDNDDAEPFDADSMNRECNFLEDTRGGSPCRSQEPSFFSDCPSMEVDSAIDMISPESSQNLSADETTDASLANVSHSTELNGSRDSTNPNCSLDTTKFIPQIAIKTTAKPVEAPLKLNFLGLPEKLLRKKAIFALPKDMTKKEKKKAEAPETIQPAEEGSETSFKPISGILTFEKNCKETPKERLFISLNEDMLRNIPTPPPTPTPDDDDDEDFFGFDEGPDFKFGALSSTLTRLSLDSSLLLGAKANRSMSQDSGFLTPPHSLRFSCDEAGPSDLDSGLGVSCLDDDSQINRSSLAGLTTLDTIVEFDEPPAREKTPEMDEAALELSAKHKKLQDLADKRMQDRLDETKDVTMEVNKWHSYLKPILKESHARGNFDIHELGTEILSSFPAPDTKDVATVTFADVVRGKEQPDICRYFLSTLLLANTENVRLNVEPKAKNQVTEFEEMRLTFLTAERHYQDMEAMYDDQGEINTKVKKRMRADMEDEVEARHLEKTPPKKKKPTLMQKKMSKALELSPTDSGYLSGYEEDSSVKNMPGASFIPRKRAADGSIVVKSQKVRNTLLQ